MMRIEISINDEKDIGNIIVHNTGKTKGNQTIYDVYDGTHSEDAEVLSDLQKIGSVEHRRQSGAAVLATKTMEEVVTEEHLK